MPGQTNNMEDSQFPWQRTLYILVFSQLVVSMGFSSVYPFLPLFVTQLGSTTGMGIELLSGLVYSAHSFTMMIASPIWGSLADRFGRKIMVQRAMFGGALILLLMAFATSAEQLVALRAIQGLLTGTVSATSALLASVVPNNQKGYAMGFLQVGFGTGIAFGPLLGGAVADTFGYNTVLFLTAGMLTLGGITVAVGINERFHTQGVYVSSTPGIIKSWNSIISIPGMSVTFAIRFLSSLGRIMIIPIIPLFIQSFWTDSSRLNTFTGLALGVASGFTTITAVIFGRIADRIGYRKILIGCTSLLAIVYTLQGFISFGWQLIILQGVVGVCLGGLLPIISAMLANFSKTVGVGSVFGLDNSINAAGRALAPLVGTTILSFFGFPAAFATAGIVFLIISLLAFWSLPSSRSTP